MLEPPEVVVLEPVEVVGSIGGSTGASGGNAESFIFFVLSNLFVTIEPSNLAVSLIWKNDSLLRENKSIFS